jgi:hypothetical protein
MLKVVAASVVAPIPALFFTGIVIRMRSGFFEREKNQNECGLLMIHWSQFLSRLFGTWTSHQMDRSMEHTAPLVVNVLLVATAKIVAVKVGTSIDPPCLPCLPAGLTWPTALVVCLPCLRPLIVLLLVFLWISMPSSNQSTSFRYLWFGAKSVGRRSFGRVSVCRIIP